MPNKITVYIDGPAKSGRSALAELLLNGMHRAGISKVNLYEEDGVPVEAVHMPVPPGFRPFNDDGGAATIAYVKELAEMIGFDVDIKIRDVLGSDPAVSAVHAFMLRERENYEGFSYVAEVLSRAMLKMRDEPTLSVAAAIHEAENQFLTS